MNLGVRLVRLALRCYPAAFRRRFGPEMLAVYLDRRDACRGVSRRRAAWATITTLVNLLASAPGVWRDQRLRRRPMYSQPGATAMQRFLTDLRQVVRTLRAQPAFALVTIGTLALGIGANTAVFSALNGVVLAPLPYPDPAGLVRFYVASDRQPDNRNYLTGLDLLDLAAEEDAFSAVGAMYTYRETGRDLSAPGEPPRRIRVLLASSGYFRTLGATPALGRTFTPEEDVDGIERVVLSHRLWRDATGADPRIIGGTVELSGRRYEVIGVMRPGFRDLAGPDVDAWLPTDLRRGGENNRGNHYLSAVARLKPGVSPAQAQARVNAMTTRLAAENPGPQDERRLIRVVPLLDDVVGDSRGSLIFLMAAAGLVLLIACLNVANLFLARSIGQSRDLAVRTALGAGRGRLVAQRLMESIAVAAVGGVVGSAVAFWGVRALLAVSPESLARSEEIGFDPRLLGFAIATTLVTGVVFGLAPAWRAARTDPSDALREGARGNTGGRGSRRARDVLVAAQVAVALMLLIGAGVLMRSFARLQQVDLGFDADQVETFEINLPEARYGDAAARVRFHHDFADRLRAIPGVEQVGAASWLPGNGRYHHWGMQYLDADGVRQWVGAQVRVIDGDFLESLRIPIVSGRALGRADVGDTVRVALISRALAASAFGERSPLGESVRVGSGTFRIVGVTGNAAAEPTGDEPPIAYLGHDQFAGDRNWTLHYVVRTSGRPEPVVAPARAALAAMDPALVLFRPRPLEAMLAGHRARERFTLLLMGVFAVVALSLAAIGLYGVLSYSVTQRQHEIGVRMALGARAGQVRGAVLRHALGIGALGALVGLAGAVAGARLIQSASADVQPRDPLVVGVVLLLLGAVIVAAGYLPARRATQVDPLESLRGE